MAIVTPAFVKAYHVFENHEHKACNEKYATHFHELDIDCDFYKFKLNSPFYYNSETEENNFQDLIASLNVSYYTLLRSHNKDTSYLRGPPNLA